MGPSVEGEKDIKMVHLKDLYEMEVLATKNIDIGEGALGEDKPALEIQSHDSLLGEIEELKFLLRKLISLLDKYNKDNESLHDQIQKLKNSYEDWLRYREERDRE